MKHGHMKDVNSTLTSKIMHVNKHKDDCVGVAVHSSSLKQDW